ncbi:MAG: FAD-binding oxidoreductase [Actinobacteria bacterium]|nr:FAD-binding oxidoreductase [Actinomycetota bacterium]
MPTTDPPPRPGAGGGPAAEVDAAGLASALRRAVEGEVRFSDGDRHLYATDASNFRQVPIGVVIPRTVEDVIRTHALCREFDAPITNRGGGTSLAGQATNVAVILDTSKYLRSVGEVDREDRRVTCQPGIVLDDLRDHTRRQAGLIWGPDPATHDRCTVGGMIGNNACGIRAFAHGRTEDNVHAMEVLLYDGTRMTVGPTPEDDLEDIIRHGGRKGEIHRRLRDLRDRYADAIRERFPDIPRRVSGYNLTQLLPENGFNVARALVGTEGTCATILDATLDLNHDHPARSLLVLGYPDVYAAGDHVGEIRQVADALAVEGFDEMLTRRMREKRLPTDAMEYLPAGNAWLLLEFGGETRQESDAKARDLLSALRSGGVGPSAELYEDDREARAVWRAREAGLGATAHFRGTDSWPGWEDSAVHPNDLGDYLRDLRGLLDDHGYQGSFYGHFGDGCVHCRIDFDLASRPGIDRYRRFLGDAADLVSAYGGSYSGEHGDGQQRGALLERMYGTELVDAFREFKAIWDPDDRMNPGKVVDAYDVDRDLRLGPDFRLPVEGETSFGYPHDGGSFARAQMRCVGVGKCRRDDGGGTMCPSYMVTHEEMHSTRGRARLLFEMLRPDSQLDGWRDETVKRSLDLCLSCKGCVIDCPVDVDIPTYKAEFLHRYYDGRIHPRAHYALGLIDVWSRLAAWMPGIVNRVLNAPGVGAVLKRAAGVTTERSAPRYAERTFRDWFEHRDARDRGARRVLLFPDTFTNHFHPEVGRATVEVLEDAGYQVTIPDRRLCCGRPLYDHGFLDLAHRYLDTVIENLRDDVRAGVPIVGVEPSCVAVFRDELIQMKPDDPDARRIADATHTLGGFLTTRADYEFPTLDRRAIVHGHCHHKGVLGLDDLGAALDAMDLRWHELDAGCCGLAGSFGFEAGERYEVSVAAGERKLLPAVRDADRDTLVIADGFSCRTQIQQLQQRNGTGDSGQRRALHLAQVIRMAQDGNGPGTTGHDDAPVERRYVGDDPDVWTTRDSVATAIIGAAVTAAGVHLWNRFTGSATGGPHSDG